MKKKKIVRSHIKKIIDAGLADAKAGRVVTYDTTKTSKVAVDFPIQVDFFNDTGKNVLIRTTPWTHAKNPEMIRPKMTGKIYIQQGFLKLWDQGGYFQLLVE